MIKQAKGLLKEKLYLGCVCLTFIISYGFFLVQTFVYIDDTAMGRYFTDGRMLRQGRWGLWLLTNLLHQTEFIPYLHKICGLLVYFLSCVLIAGLFKEMSGNKLSIKTLTVFSCIMCSYSLINEILFYNSAQWLYSLVYLFAALSAVYLLKNDIKSLGYAVLFMTLGLSVSEGVAGVFIILVAACVILKNKYQLHVANKVSNLLKLAGAGIIVLLAAIVLERVIAIIFCIMTGWDLQTRAPIWFSNPFVYVLKRLVVTMTLNFGIRSLFYFPILEFAAAFLVNLGIVVWKLFKRKYYDSLLWGGFAFGSLVFPIVQGEASPNRVIWQVFAIYT